MIQTTDNFDHNEIFSQDPEHVNNEHVCSAKIKKEPIYIDPTFAEDQESIDFLKKHLVTIVTPSTIAGVQQKAKSESSRILQSPCENGRVLEGAKRVMLGNMPYTIAIKGVGATKNYRKTGGMNPSMFFGVRPPSKEKLESLKHFPFYNHAGVLDLDDALKELKISQLLQEMEIDTQRVLAIFELDEVMGRDGEYTSITQLQEEGIIPNDACPVILIRAHKSNHRLLDIISLEDYKRTDSIASLTDHILSESEKYWETKDMNEYMQKLIKTVLQNRLELIKGFSRLNGERWQDVFRNFSVFGEELDLGWMDPMEESDSYFVNPFDIINHYNREIKTLNTGFSTIIDVVERHTPHRCNHQEIADLIFDTIISWIKNHINEFKGYYEKYNWDERYNSVYSQGFNSFMRDFLAGIFGFILNYTNEQKYRKILENKIKQVLERK